MAHRLAWQLYYGVRPPVHIDHRDNDGLNNRIKNLRRANKAENNWNAGVRSDNKSGVKGVFFDNATQKFRASISIGGKQRSVGYFKTISEAEKALSKTRKKLHGEFARQA